MCVNLNITIRTYSSWILQYEHIQAEYYNTKISTFCPVSITKTLHSSYIIKIVFSTFQIITFIIKINSKYSAYSSGYSSTFYRNYKQLLRGQILKTWILSFHNHTVALMNSGNFPVPQQAHNHDCVIMRLLRSRRSKVTEATYTKATYTKATYTEATYTEATYTEASYTEASYMK